MFCNTAEQDLLALFSGFLGENVHEVLRSNTEQMGVQLHFDLRMMPERLFDR